MSQLSLPESEPLPTPSSALELPQHNAPESFARRSASQIWRLFVFLWKYAFGALAAQALLGSVLLLGWVLRWMQRATLKTWWKKSPRANDAPSFAAWLALHHPASPHRHAPNWFLAQNYSSHLARPPGVSLFRHGARCARAAFESLKLNFMAGLQAAFNVAVVTMPGCLLWLFAWYAGWNNSFHRGYEMAPVGPLTGILGIALFIAAMFHLPLAQARQAATGDWKSFYQFSFVWSLTRRHWPACLMLALAFSLCSLPVQMIKTWLMFAPNAIPALADLSPEKALDFLNSYFFAAAFVFLPLYLLLRLLAARIYAHAIVSGLQRGQIATTQLAETERNHLSTLGMLQTSPPRARHPLVRVAAGTSAGVLRTLGLGAIAGVWFLFVAQIFIAEFLMYHPIAGWLNQPLVQLPWFRYIPPQLQNQAGELGGLLGLLALLGAGLAARSLLRYFRTGR